MRYGMDRSCLFLLLLGNLMDAGMDARLTKPVDGATCV